MFYLSKTVDYLKIFTDKEFKDFVLNKVEKENREKLLNCFIIFLTTLDKDEKSSKIIEKMPEAKILDEMKFSC